MSKLRKVNGQWLPLYDRYRKVAGIWRKVVLSYRKIGGIWRIVYGDRKEMVVPLEEQTDMLNGSHSIKWEPDANRYSVYVSGSVSAVSSIMVGLTINHIPPESTVTIDWAGAKGGYSGNEIFVESNGSLLLRKTQSFSREQPYFDYVNGSMRIYIKFVRGNPADESSFELYGIYIDDCKIF